MEEEATSTGIEEMSSRSLTWPSVAIVAYLVRDDEGRGRGRIARVLKKGRTEHREERGSGMVLVA